MNAKVNAILTLYRHRRITKAQMKESVPTIITAEEYEEITGEVYTKSK